MLKPIRLACLLAAAAAFFSACSPEPGEPPAIDAALAMRLTAEVSQIIPRHSGSPGAKATVEFIAAELKKSGLTPEIDEWRENPAAAGITFRNVSTRIPGRDNSQFVIIGGHYDAKKIDSVPNFAAANDGGSSTGLLLAIADAIQKKTDKPPCAVVIAFFDGEECLNNYNESDGLHGSKRMAEKIKLNGNAGDCRAVIILDMIGDADLGVTLPADTNPELAAVLMRETARQGTAKHFKWAETPILDDHVPFQKLGIPAIDIIDFEFGPRNRYWHTEADTIDKVSPESLKIVGDAALALLWCLPGR